MTLHQRKEVKSQKEIVPVAERANRVIVNDAHLFGINAAAEQQPAQVGREPALHFGIDQFQTLAPKYRLMCHRMILIGRWACDDGIASVQNCNGGP